MQSIVTLGDLITIISVIGAIIILAVKGTQYIVSKFNHAEDKIECVAKTVDQIEKTIKDDIRNVVKQEMEPMVKKVDEIEKMVNEHDNMLCVNPNMGDWITKYFDLIPKERKDD